MPNIAIKINSNVVCVTSSITNRMAVMRLLMESDTVREWPARTDQVGGSLGLMTSERAVLSRWVELSSMEHADWRMGSWAAQPYNKNTSNVHLITTGCWWILDIPVVTWSYLAADLSRDAGELWIGGKRCEVFHSFNQWSRGYSTPAPVLLGEISI